ncbi:MAG: hypothetical protein P4L53_25675 [Candidatus Obscuribacterales bacterium]|nr:hypothetical protein [Candidatus Obscuribacterales bacterium]
MRKALFIPVTFNSNHRKRHGLRSHNGNMLSMVALLLGLVCFACLTSFGFYMLLSQQKNGQSGTDQYALTSASTLNAGDRIGQMNNVIERCRELVYVSRVNNDKAQLPMNKLYQALSAQLLDESRENAKLVEEERKNQIKLCVKNLQATIVATKKVAPTGKRLSLPMFESAYPQIEIVRLGYIKGVQSNVENLLVIPDLREFDVEKKYIQKGSNLYLGNINAKLPGPDDDLDFKLSALPADVKKTISPSRLTAPDVFVTTATIFAQDKPLDAKMDQLPGAIQLQEQMDVSNRQATSELKLTSTATASGASPSP